MKKVIFVFICLLSLLCSIAFTCFATEAEAVSKTEATVLSRAWEWGVENYSVILEYLIDAAILLLVKILFSRLSKQGKSLDIVNDNSSRTVNGQDIIVKKMDEIIDAVNESEHISEQLQKTEEHVENMVDTVKTMMVSLFEMMTMIHTQNRNLPQGTRDRVTQIFANSMKLVEENSAFSDLSLSLKSSYDIIAKGGNENDEKNESEGS